MNEELTGAGGGVEAPPAAEPAAQAQGAGAVQGEAATAEQPTPATATEPTRVNLDDMPEFRKWKSQADSRYAQTQAELARARQEAAEARRQAEEARRQWTRTQLQDRPSEEVAAFYEQELAKKDQQYRQREEQNRIAQEVYREGNAMLTQAGISPDHPGLDWGGDNPSYENLTRLQASVTRILAAQVRELSQKQKAEVQKATRQATTKALEDAGVTQVSTATGAPASNLMAQYQAERAKLVGTGAMHLLVDLNKRYREKGLEM